MEDKPRVWHYGLIAKTWKEFSADTPEFPFLERQIESYDQPVLNLACRTGRLLLPFLRAGIDIDGCDISGDMLGFLEEKAIGEGLSPRLYEQPMHELDLPRKYKTIYICGSFGLAGSRRLDQETLLRCLNHLDDGGSLVFNIYPEYADVKSWMDWLKVHREAMPEPWPEEGRRRETPDGTEYVTMSRMMSVDPLEQSYTREMRVEKWRAGTMIAKRIAHCAVKCISEMRSNSC